MLKRKEKEAVCEPKSKKIKKSVSNDSNETNNENKKQKSSQSKDTLKSKKEKRAKFKKPLAKPHKTNKESVLQKNDTNVGNEKHKLLASKNCTTMEKPDWLEFKKKKKELKEKRKAKRFTNIYDISVKAKQISEKLRRSDCSQQERKKLILKTHNLLKNHYNKMIFTHDMSRIIQWILRYCEIDVRQAILNELKPLLISILQSKYAKNCIKTILKYGTQEIRSEITSTCYGNIVNLMSHSVSAPLLELVYSNWATETEKIYFKQEFYGDMYKHAKDKNIKSLSDVFKTAKDMKSATLSAVKGNLTRILNKKFLNSTLVQGILLEFLNECSPEDRNEMIVMLRSSIVELSKTKIGAKVAVTCVWHGTNKDRKIIMKALKENVKAVSMSEHGYIILLALFDSVDDTVLVKKIILSEIQTELTEIALNEYGKHVILYLVARRNSRYFPPSSIQNLQQGDNNVVSKKPADIREKELLESMSDLLLDAVIADTAVWMSNSSIAMVTLAILKVGSGDKLKHAFQSIAAFITNSQLRIKEAENEYVPVEHAGLHLMLKKLIQNDKDLQQKGECTFGEILTEQLTVEILETWIDFNRGCFLLILLLENESKSTISTLLSKLKPMSKNIKSKTSSGASILMKKLK